MRRTAISASLAVVALLTAGRADTAAQSAAPAVSTARLQAVFDGFKGTRDQRAPLVDAVNASPALTRQLAALTNAGQLAAIDVAPPQRPPAAPFAAAIDRDRIAFTAGFLAQPSKRRLIAAAPPDEILPNNLVFVLGSLAFHLEHAPAPSPRASDLVAFRTARLEQDARSFIQGWNDVVDAAVTENANRPLSVQQQGALLANLRYRAVLLNTDGPNGIVWAGSGAIDPTEQNVAAVMAIVAQAKLLDFGVPPSP